MNKILLLVGVILLSISCGSERDNITINTVFVKNSTSTFCKLRVYLPETNDSVFHDLTVKTKGDTISFCTQRVSTQREAGMSVRLELFNLDDTTSFFFDDALLNHIYTYPPDNKNDSILKSSFHMIFNEYSTKHDYHYNVNINDSLLTILKKDNTMLKKFKDYYSSKP